MDKHNHISYQSSFVVISFLTEQYIDIIISNLLFNMIQNVLNNFCFQKNINHLTNNNSNVHFFSQSTTIYCIRIILKYKRKYSTAINKLYLKQYIGYINV